MINKLKINQLLDHTEEGRGTTVSGRIWSITVHHKGSVRKWEQFPYRFSSASNSEAPVITQYSSNEAKNLCHKCFHLQVKWLWQNNLHSEIKEKTFLVWRKQSSGLCFCLNIQDEIFGLVFPLRSGPGKQQSKINQFYCINQGRCLNCCFYFLTSFPFGR